MKCHIRIKEHLDPSWQEWIEGLQIIHEEGGTSLLSGGLPDQAALFGVLLKLRELGLTLLSLETRKESEYRREKTCKNSARNREQIQDRE